MADPKEILNAVESKAAETTTPHIGKLLRFERNQIDTLTKNPDGLLTELKDRIKLLEQLKYPNPPYECKNVTIAVNGKPASVLYTKFNNELLNDSQLLHMEKMSLLLRKLNMIAGVVNAASLNSYVAPLQQSSLLMGMLMEAQNAMSDYFTKPLNQKLDLSKNMNSFIDNMVEKFGRVKIDKDEAIGKIRNAEKYFVAESNSNRYIINELVGKDNKKIIQMDVPFNNKLTQEQQSEFKKIQSNGKDEWFSHQSAWEKQAFSAMVSKSNFDNVYQSSAMQNTPGIKNGRTNYLMEKLDNHVQVLSRSFKTATQVPYEAPARFRDSLTQMNTEQILDKVKGQNDFQEKWGNILDNNQEIKPLVFFHSLLSDTKLGGNDKALVTTQAKAIEATALKVAGEFTLMHGNDPVNMLRIAVGDKGSIASKLGRTERWEHVEKLQAYAENFMSKINPSVLAQHPEQQQALELIKAANAALTDLPSQKSSFGQSRTAFKAAYLGILVENLGGTFISNCKSGKDRTGLDELYRNSMRLFFQEHQKLPLFNDKGQDRENFNSIFISLFNSMKTQEAAAANTPGSFGIKDTAMMLERDIVKELGQSYSYSNQRSGMNKPSVITKDEAKANSLLKKLDAEYKPLAEEKVNKTTEQKTVAEVSYTTTPQVHEELKEESIAEPIIHDEVDLELDSEEDFDLSLPSLADEGNQDEDISPAFKIHPEPPSALESDFNENYQASNNFEVPTVKVR